MSGALVVQVGDESGQQGARDVRQDMDRCFRSCAAHVQQTGSRLSGRVTVGLVCVRCLRFWSGIVSRSGLVARDLAGSMPVPTDERRTGLLRDEAVAVGGSSVACSEIHELLEIIARPDNDPHVGHAELAIVFIDYGDDLVDQRPGDMPHAAAISLDKYVGETAFNTVNIFDI